MIYFTAVLSVGMFLIGRWGSRRARELVPSTLSPMARRKMEGSMLRGAWVLRIVGLLLFGFSAVGIGDLLLGPR